MKLLTFLILTISIAATFIPCCEFDQCDEKITTSSNENQEEQDASCSPLSICHTCSTPIVMARTIELPVHVVSGIERKSLEPWFLLPAHASAFWQPPRFELRA